MKQITRKELVALGGSFDATWAILDAKGELYFSTKSPQAARTEAYWEGKHMTLCGVINQREDE